MTFATHIAAMIEDALNRFRVPASKIVDQLSGTQVAPAQAGSPGVVDLDNVVSPGTLAAHTGRTDNPHAVTAAQVGAIATSALTSANPSALAAAAAPGSSGSVARIDHVHPYPTAANIGAAATSHVHAAGDITSGILAVARGGTGWATQPAFFVYRDSPQSGITNTTHHKVLWTHKLYDTAGLFDLANSRCTLKTGKWQFIISIVFTSTAAVAGRYFVARIYKNGSLFFSPVGFVAQASVTTYPGFAVPVSIDAVNNTDYYEIYVYHNNGNTLSLDGNASYATHWSAIQLGA